MAHFARLNDQNKVTQVVVVNNDVATDEAAGVAFLKNIYDQNTIWKQTSCLLYTSPSPRDRTRSRMPSSA